ncbi:mitochondrial import inner membrane translocase subunit Tim23 [Cylas formicarius]|uniref:mitochondrial import inner membrane translocase subunit Tim23 n=1 Tax=Cylas formicarius TaxID=197179 RepID=UPI002958BEE1|nr:mitochondrial import inner membrane translocase subunit Tim23 [Cylas formicarius]
MALNGSNDIYSQNYGGTGGLTGQFKPFSSPYLNFDPGYIPQTQPEFIFLDGGSKQRGRFELAFGQIGGSCMIGAGLGGASGLYNGLKATTLAGQTGKLRRTQLLNHIMKQGSATANSFGSVAVIYSAFGVILSWARGADDDLNTIVAATATGCLYKATAGLKKCGMGGAVGLGASLLYAVWNNRDKISEIGRFNPAQR